MASKSEQKAKQLFDQDVEINSFRLPTKREVEIAKFTENSWSSIRKGPFHLVLDPKSRVGKKGPPGAALVNTFTDGNPSYSDLQRAKKKKEQKAKMFKPFPCMYKCSCASL